MIRMRDRKQFVIRLGMITVLIGALCTLVPSALGQTRPEVLAAGASANVWLAGGEAVVETPQPEQVVPRTTLSATPWGHSGAGVAQKRDRALPLPENYNPDMAAGTHRDRLCSGSRHRGHASQGLFLLA